MTWPQGNLVLLLTNREFKPPADGFFHVVPMGEFTNEEAGVVQVCDAAAMKAMKEAFDKDAEDPNFPGLLVDYDHQSHDSDKSTEAAGWITQLENRPAGLFAQIRWSNVGEEKVKGGVFRLVSPVFRFENLQDLGKNRVRPLKLARLAVTNDPNMSGLIPLSNRTSEATKNKSTMIDYKSVLLNLLGLADGATDEEITAAITAANTKRQEAAAANAAATAAATTAKAEAANRKAEVTTLQNRVTALESERDGLLSEQIDRDLEAFADVIENRDEMKKLLVSNRTTALSLLKQIKKPAAPGAGAGGNAGKQPIHNRASASTPAPVSSSDGKTPEVKALEEKSAWVCSRAREIVRAAHGKMAFNRAHDEASREYASRKLS